MKELLEMSYELINLYPSQEESIEELIDECLKELENGAKKDITIEKYKELLKTLTEEDE